MRWFLLVCALLTGCGVPAQTPAPSAVSAPTVAPSDLSVTGVLSQPGFRGDQATILGLHLGQTWDEAQAVVRADPRLLLVLDEPNPGRFYVHEVGGPDGDRALFYCQWPSGPGMARMVIYARALRFLPAGDAGLFGGTSAATLPAAVKAWLGPETRSVVTLDIEMIGLKLTSHVYESRSLEVTDFVSTGDPPHVFVAFVRPDLLEPAR